MTGIAKSAIIRAWAILIGLSAASAVLTLVMGVRIDRKLAGALILLFALFKARVILADYLGLANAPTWQRGFNLTLTVFCGLLLGLYLI